MQRSSTSFSRASSDMCQSINRSRLNHASPRRSFSVSSSMEALAFTSEPLRRAAAGSGRAGTSRFHLLHRGRSSLVAGSPGQVVHPRRRVLARSSLQRSKPRSVVMARPLLCGLNGLQRTLFAPRAAGRYARRTMKPPRFRDGRRRLRGCITGVGRRHLGDGVARDLTIAGREVHGTPEPRTMLLIDVFDRRSRRRLVSSASTSTSGCAPLGPVRSARFVPHPPLPVSRPSGAPPFSLRS